MISGMVIEARHRAPVVALPLDQAEDDAEQAGGHQRHADQVEPVAAARPQIGDDEQRSARVSDADGHVEEEDPAPAPVGDDEAAQGGAGQHGQAGQHAHGGEGAAAALGREEAGDEGQSLRRHQRRAQALHGARDDQPGGDPAPGRCPPSPSVKIDEPSAKMLRGPKMSPSRPEVISSTAKSRL